MAERTDRRGFLNKTLLGTAGVGAAYSFEESILLAAVDEGKAGTPRPKPDINPNSMPRGKIGNVSISRLFLGGNLIGGWAHSRDLIYVSKLFKAYNTEAKIYETLEMAELCGINTALVDPRDWEPLLQYNRQRNRNFQAMVCTLPGTEMPKMGDHVKQLVDRGASLVYVHGMVADTYVMNGQVDTLAKIMELIHRTGVPAGVGSHSLQTPIACEKNNVGADFYVKTFHTDRYWSATPKEQRQEWCWYKPMTSEHGKYHDNMFCIDPEETAEFMLKVEKPWVAFKTMAAGAIHPQVGFSYAYRHGADFIVAGMFDFQVEQDAKLALEALGKVRNRKRPWRA